MFLKLNTFAVYDTTTNRTYVFDPDAKVIEVHAPLVTGVHKKNFKDEDYWNTSDDETVVDTLRFQSLEMCTKAWVKLVRKAEED
jgi:hypothetical protein